MVARRSDGPWDIEARLGSVEDPLVDDYNEVELARIDRTGDRAPLDDAAIPLLGLINGGEPVDDQPLPPVPRYPVARRLGITGAMLAGAMFGVAEVLEPERARQHLIEFAPDQNDEDSQLVTFEMVPGAPRLSRLVIRPWLR